MVGLCKKSSSTSSPALSSFPSFPSLPPSFISFFFQCLDGTWSLAPTRQVLHHWATFQRYCFPFLVRVSLSCSGRPWAFCPSASDSRADNRYGPRLPIFFLFIPPCHHHPLPPPLLPLPSPILLLHSLPLSLPLFVSPLLYLLIYIKLSNRSIYSFEQKTMNDNSLHKNALMRSTS